MPRPQEQEGAPESPQFGGVGDPITISDGSGGDRLSKDACSKDAESSRFKHHAYTYTTTLTYSVL